MVDPLLTKMPEFRPGNQLDTFAWQCMQADAGRHQWQLLDFCDTISTKLIQMALLLVNFYREFR